VTRLDSPGFQFPRCKTLLRNVHTGCGAHPASYSITTALFPEDKAAGAWSWLLTSI